MKKIFINKLFQYFLIFILSGAIYGIICIKFPYSAFVWLITYLVASLLLLFYDLFLKKQEKMKGRFLINFCSILIVSLLFLFMIPLFI